MDKYGCDRKLSSSDLAGNNRGLDNVRIMRSKFLSPLTRRVLAINILALGILVGGLLLLGPYRDSLIESKVKSLTTNGAIIAGALGEGAVAGLPGDIALNKEIATEFVRRLSKTTGTRVRLFDEAGVLVADSFILLGGHREVEARILGAPIEDSYFSRIVEWIFEQMDQSFSPGQSIPLGQESLSQGAGNFPEVLDSLNGEVKSALREASDGDVVVSVALPVQRFKKVLGSLLLSVDGDDIEAGVNEVRVAILQLFVLALAVTIMLSIYLAATITGPIRRLAQAADIVRRGPTRRVTIPDLTPRSDEIGYLSGALRDMTTALYDRIEAIEAFAADVAHEIRNPLTSIRSAIELLAHGGEVKRQEKLAVIIKEDVLRLDRLIGDIAEASRIDAELARAETLPVNIGKLIQTLVNVEFVSDDVSQLRVDVFIEEEFIMMVEGVEGRLGQVIRNLLSNATSFSPIGGVVLITICRDNAKVKVKIEDDGPGIPEGMHQAIFERFYTERPKLEAFGIHSGLGLSISRQIIEAHGGELYAENRRNQLGERMGARFVIELPLIEASI